MITLKTRLLGLAATLGILAFVIGTPALLIAIDALPSMDSFSWTVLRSPDDGTFAMAVIGVVAWLAWAIMTASVTLEALARLRGVHAPQLPGFGVPQLAAGRLVATAALLFITSPLGTQASPAPAPQVAEGALTLATAPVTPIPHETHAVETPTQQATPPVTVKYLTKRGDSLWKIADEHLGDGRRYVEIVALNASAINGQPDFIPVGLTLRLPVKDDSPAQGDSPAQVVEPGDTLSEIADETLGDPMRYPELFEASQDTIQPDGQRLTDPDLIRPGWRITAPNTSSPETPSPEVVEPERPTDPSTKNQDETPGAEETEPPSETATAAPTPHDTSHEVDDEGTQVPGWLLPGLSGGGAVLAGAVLLVVRAHRRTQLRHRRPGHVIALPPTELLPVEKTLQVTGTPMVHRIEKLDDILRHLRANAIEIPALEALELTTDAATLHLAEPADLPAPWNGAGTRWSAPLDADVPVKPDEPAPYPLLVTVGQGDNGSLWLINLEQLQNVAIIGDPDKSEALGRHLVAELALNPWSSRVDVIALGIGHELDAVSHRLAHHAADENNVLAKLEDYLTGDNRFDGLDPEIFHAVVTAAGDPSAVATAVDLIAQHPWRPGAAVVTINERTAQDAVEIQVMPEGRLQIPALGLDLVACGLTTEEAAVCAAVVDVTRDAENTPMPIEGSPTDELEGLIDSSGAVRRDFTEPRPNGPAGNDSLLPLASEEYEASSSTVAEDIEVLAPVTPLSTRRRVEGADPALDEDVAAWLDNESRRPRLTLLGPVGARAYGDPTVVARRKPFYVEMLAFLALHPGGATSQQVADAFSITTGRARNDLSKLRGWLGDDPPTGQRYLPPAERNGKYRVDRVLCDLDLFRRLRARGQARGADGVCDLVSALSLVTGEPFSDGRETGWNWLLEGERLDHVMTCAIVDAGHIVTTHALATYDLDLARTAAEASYLAAPYDEVAQLDLIEVAAKSGHTQVAERHLADRIFNRSDDDLGPIELSDRTARIARRRGDRGRWPSQADAAPLP